MSIWDLQNRAGDMVDEDAHLKLLGEHHFYDLCKDDGSTNIVDQLKVINIFPTFVQEDERGSYFSKITLLEVEVVLKGFKKDKSPSPDGWPLDFFLSFFYLVGSDILRVVE